MSATLPLREALNESISSGRFEDTKIILYSRRNSSGDVCKPRALYASSRVLKTVPYFDDRKSLVRPSSADHAANNTLRVLSGNFAEAKSKDFSETVDDSETAEDYGYYSDSDLEDGNDDLVHSDITGTAVPPKDHHSSSSTGDHKSLDTHGEHMERPQQGKVIQIQDIAFITYIYPQKEYHCAA